MQAHFDIVILYLSYFEVQGLFVMFQDNIN